MGYTVMCCSTRYAFVSGTGYENCSFKKKKTITFTRMLSPTPHHFIFIFPRQGILQKKFNDQFPVHFLAQLVEHCTGIAKVRVPILVSLNFSGFLFATAQVTVQAQVTVGSSKGQLRQYDFCLRLLCPTSMCHDFRPYIREQFFTYDIHTCCMDVVGLIYTTQSDVTYASRTQQS